jgi:hypothetical protein
MRAKKHKKRARFLLACAFVALAGIGASAIALNSRTDSDGILPPLPEEAGSASEQPHRSPAPGEVRHTEDEHEDELGLLPAPGAASLAGPAASVVERFAELWANRNVVITHAIKREMVGLSAGAWAGAVFRQARLTLPAIEGVRAEGGMVMMKLSSVAPKSKTALVVTQERLLDDAGVLAPPRYELYLARVDRVTPEGYAITAWEPQQ